MAVLKQLFRGVLYKKMFLEILKNSQGNICARVSFLKELEASCNFIAKETVFSCKSSKIFKYTHFEDLE